MPSPRQPPRPSFLAPTDPAARLERWIAILRAAAEASGHPATPDAAFADELGHRRPVDGPFIAHRRNEPPPPIDPRDAQSIDVRLWHALASGSSPDLVLEDADSQTRGCSGSDAGALAAQRDDQPLEIWTEAELAALHALDRFALALDRPDLERRVRRVARWHIDNTQPDNATNRAWAIHVFAWLSIAPGPADHDTDRPRNADDTLADHAGMYAETLLHNCQVSLGHADALSAQVMLDGAAALEQRLATLRDHA